VEHRPSGKPPPPPVSVVHPDDSVSLARRSTPNLLCCISPPDLLPLLHCRLVGVRPSAVVAPACLDVLASTRFSLHQLAVCLPPSRRQFRAARLVYKHIGISSCRHRAPPPSDILAAVAVGLAVSLHRLFSPPTPGPNHSPASLAHLSTPTPLQSLLLVTSSSSRLTNSPILTRQTLSVDSRLPALLDLKFSSRIWYVDPALLGSPSSSVRPSLLPSLTVHACV
jgi:hypothetical protein